MGIGSSIYNTFNNIFGGSVSRKPDDSIDPNNNMTDSITSNSSTITDSTLIPNSVASSSVISSPVPNITIIPSSPISERSFTSEGSNSDNPFLNTHPLNESLANANTTIVTNATSNSFDRIPIGTLLPNLNSPSNSPVSSTSQSIDMDTRLYIDNHQHYINTNVHINREHHITITNSANDTLVTTSDVRLAHNLASPSSSYSNASVSDLLVFANAKQICSSTIFNSSILFSCFTCSYLFS